MIEVNKKENESSLSLIRRFTKRVKQSSNLSRVRGMRFRKRPKSELKRKEEAIKREKNRKRTEYLRKLGKID